MISEDNKKETAGLATEQQYVDLDKKIEGIELKKKEISKEKGQVLVRIASLKAQLELIYKRETTAENKVAEIKAQEEKASSRERKEVEKKRWEADTERRKIEQAKWQIVDEIKKQQKLIKELDFRYGEVEKEEKWILEEEKEEILREKQRKELLQKKTDLENEFSRIGSQKKSVAEKRKELSINKDKLKIRLEYVLEEEKNAEDALEKIEVAEKEVSDPEEKEEIERKRWKTEDARKNLEKQKWELEEEKEKLLSLLEGTEAEYQRILQKENSLGKEINEIIRELGLSSEQRLPQAPEMKKEEEKKTSPKALPEPPKPTAKPPEEIQEKKQGYQAIFKEALDSYKKGEFDVAKNLLIKITAAEDIKKERPASFWAKIARILGGATIKEKAEDILEKIKAKEERAQIERQKAEEPRAKTEGEREEDKEREELRRYQKWLVEKYKDEFKIRQEEAVRKYQDEWERRRREILQEQKELQESKEELRKEAMGEVVRQEKMREQEKELEKQKAEIRKRYEEELQRIEKELQERHERELGTTRAKRETLKAEESKKTAEKIKAEQPEKEEIEEIISKPEEIISEESVKEERKVIEEATKRIEEEEAKRKQSEEGLKEGKGFQEEMGAPEEEIGNRRARLKEEIMMAMTTPEEVERGKKVKAENLEALFKEAVFHYKERNLDKAVEVFQELKREMPEPKKEPTFFSRVLGKVPPYVQVEDYISRIEREKEFEKKGQVRIIRERARIASGEKQKAEHRSFSKFKEGIRRFLPTSPAVIFRKFLFLPPLVAIDISDYSIELLRLDKKFSVLSYGRSIIKEGVVYEGEIKNQKELSLAFKLAVNQAGFNSFKPRLGPILRGIVSIPEYKTNVQMFTFDSKENIFGMVEEEIKKTVPFPIEKLYWDYLARWDEKSNRTEALSVAVPRDTIDEQIYFLKSVGVDPVVFDFEAASIGRALLPDNVAPGEENIMILDIGAMITNMNIFDEGRFINLSVAIPSGGYFLIDRVAKHFGVSKDEAETIINIKGFSKENNIILETLEKGMEEIVEETKRTVKYYQKNTGREVKKIILAGGTALFPEIEKFFQSRFQGIEIEIGGPLKKVKRRGGIDPTKAILYANSLGLALRSIVRDPVGGGINLLPGKIKEKEKKVYWQRHRRRLIIIRVIVAVLIAAAVFLAYSILFGGFFKLPYN